MSCNIKGKNGEPGPKVFDIESHDFLVFLDGVLSEMEFMEVESFYDYEAKYIKEKTLVYSFTGTAFDDGEKYGFYQLFFAPNNVGTAFLYELARPSEKKTYALSNDISEDIQARVGEELAKYIPQE